GMSPNARGLYNSLGDDQQIVKNWIKNGWGCTACHVSKDSWHLEGVVNPENGLIYDHAVDQEGFRNWALRSNAARSIVEFGTTVGMARAKFMNAPRAPRVPNDTMIKGKNRRVDTFDAEVDLAIDNSISFNFWVLPANSGKMRLTGQGLTNIKLKMNPEKPIWFHDNLLFRKIQDAPHTKVEVRTHSPNPNPRIRGTYSSNNNTTQINTNPNSGPKLYRLPDGSWKTIDTMTDAEKVAAHYH
ncbi:hypothetical protein ACS8FD_13720, partial [Psychrobacter sp. 1U2]